MLKESLKVEFPILKKHSPENPENKILRKKLTFQIGKKGSKEWIPKELTR